MGGWNINIDAAPLLSNVGVPSNNIKTNARNGWKI